MFEADKITDLIEQLFGRGGGRHGEISLTWLRNGFILEADRSLARPVNQASGKIIPARAGLLQPGSISRRTPGRCNPVVSRYYTARCEIKQMFSLAI